VFGHIGVQWRTSSLDGGEITPDSTRRAAFLFGKPCHGGTLLSGLDGPQNTPLAG